MSERTKEDIENDIHHAREMKAMWVQTIEDMKSRATISRMEGWRDGWESKIQELRQELESAGG